MNTFTAAVYQYHVVNPYRLFVGVDLWIITTSFQVEVISQIIIDYDQPKPKSQAIKVCHDLLFSI